jgi:hypothetical protein
LLGKSERKRTPGRKSRRWMDNTKINRGIGLSG